MQPTQQYTFLSSWALQNRHMQPLVGYADCNKRVADGCEASIDMDINNCGVCGNACPSPPNSRSVCMSGVCSFKCNSGFADCDKIAANGCEVNLGTNSANCGHCGNVVSLLIFEFERQLLIIYDIVP